MMSMCARKPICMKKSRHIASRCVILVSVSVVRTDHLLPSQSHCSVELGSHFTGSVTADRPSCLYLHPRMHVDINSTLALQVEQMAALQGRNLRLQNDIADAKAAYNRLEMEKSELEARMEELEVRNRS